jgi:hypothetical protein
MPIDGKVKVFLDRTSFVFEFSLFIGIGGMNENDYS